MRSFTYTEFCAALNPSNRRLQRGRIAVRKPAPRKG